VHLVDSGGTDTVWGSAWPRAVEWAGAVAGGSEVERGLGNALLGRRLQALGAQEARQAAAKARAVHELVCLRAAEAAGRAGTRGDDRCVADDASGAAGWGPPEGADGVGHLRAGIPESVVDEVMLVENTSRQDAHVLVEVAVMLVEHLPDTLGALEQGRIDPRRARTIARGLSAPARDGADVLVGAVEAAVLPRAGEWSLTGLDRAIRRELTARDPDQAEQRRARQLRSRDVTSRSLGDGIGELRWRDDLATLTAAQQTIDQFAALAKKDGDPRPIGVIRAEVLRAMVLDPGGDRPEFTATLSLFVPVGGLAAGSSAATSTADSHETPGAGAGAGPGVAVGGWVAELDGEPITMAHARDLLDRLGFLHTPEDCCTRFVFADAADGRLRAVVTETELRQAIRRGCPAHPDEHGRPGTACSCPAAGPPPPVDRYRPSAAQERFVRTRDRACRMPGCTNRSGWSDLDHVVPHAAGGQTACENLCCLCRRDHRIKTHQPGWRFRQDPDGTLHVTTPTGITRTRRPPGTDLLGLTPPVDRPDPDPPPF
jgi:hypothetical protein